MIDRKNSPGCFFVIGILLLGLLIIPLVNTFAAFVTGEVYDTKTSASFLFPVWAFSFMWYSWTMLFFVLGPYCLFFFYVRFLRRYWILQPLLFYALLVLEGVLLDDGSIIGIYVTHQFPRAWLLYFLITIFLWPLCTMAMNKILRLVEMDSLDSSSS